MRLNLGEMEKDSTAMLSDEGLSALIKSLAVATLTNAACNAHQRCARRGS